MTRRYPPEPLTEQEALALLGACDLRRASGIRDRALIALLWRSGIRIAEALALMPAEIDIRALTLRVLHGKGDRSRAGGFDQRTADILLAWIECRKMVPTTERSPLFCTLRGKRLASANVRETIHRLGRQAGVEKRVHPHGLRHTLASQLAGAGESLVDIQVILGHASIATTAGYIRHLNPIGAISILQKGIR